METPLSCSISDVDVSDGVMWMDDISAPRNVRAARLHDSLSISEAGANRRASGRCSGFTDGSQDAVFQFDADAQSV